MDGIFASIGISLSGVLVSLMFWLGSVWRARIADREKHELAESLEAFKQRLSNQSGDRDREIEACSVIWSALSKAMESMILCHSRLIALSQTGACPEDPRKLATQNYDALIDARKSYHSQVPFVAKEVLEQLEKSYENLRAIAQFFDEVVREGGNLMTNDDLQQRLDRALRPLCDVIRMRCVV